MAIRVVVVKRPEREISYLRAALKGMAMTFRHLLQKKFTLLLVKITLDL